MTPPEARGHLTHVFIYWG